MKLLGALGLGGKAGVGGDAGNKGQVSVVERLYFGKVPARGDFVRSDRHHPLVPLLDRWMSQTLDRLAPDPRWKLTYDAAPSMAFAIVGAQGSKALAGHWQPSQDASGRRFPLLCVSELAVDPAGALSALTPLVLHAEWQLLREAAWQGGMPSDSSGADLAETSMRDGQALTLPFADGEPWPLAGAHEQLQAFWGQHSMVSFEQMLAAAGVRLSVRQALLALGLLLQPVMVQGTGKLGKDLCLPLPRNESLQALAASYWLSLISGFFERSQAELAVFMLTQANPPVLLLGFQGASAASLHSVIDPEVREREAVRLDAADWVEACVDEDWGLKKLSNYLKDPGLSLQQARQTFREVFMGAGT
jgi:type VI secretion system protein ImpM